MESKISKYNTSTGHFSTNKLTPMGTSARPLAPRELNICSQHIQNCLLKVSNVACGCVRVGKKRDHARPRTKPAGAKTRPRGTLLYSSLPYSALLYSTPLKCPEHRSFSRKLPSNNKEFACKQDSIIQDTSLFAE